MTVSGTGLVEADSRSILGGNSGLCAAGGCTLVGTDVPGVINLAPMGCQGQVSGNGLIEVVGLVGAVDEPAVKQVT